MMPNTTDYNLLERIGDCGGKLSPKQLVLAKYIEKHYKDLAYTTMTELARAANVSETTVVRFVAYLGYSGFPGFMSALRQVIESASVTGSSMSSFKIEHGKYKFPRDICSAVFALEMQVMQDTLAKIDTTKHQQAVDMLYAAPEVFVVGCGANKCCAQAMGFALEVIRKNVRIIENLDLNESSLINSAAKKAVAIVFITQRYPTAALKVTKMLKSKGIRIIGITDSVLSPIVPYCDLFFLAPEKYLSFIDTNAAYMALIHSLVYAMHFKDKPQSQNNITDYNDFVRTYDFYVNSGADLIDVDLREL